MNCFFNVIYSWRASTVTPAFSIHGLCSPITCNVGLHTGSTAGAALVLNWKSEYSASCKNYMQSNRTKCLRGVSKIISFLKLSLCSTFCMEILTCSCH